ncbi:MAG TPA: protein-glutamate O-methyltransferase CheR [Gemmatimonadales bacterium]|nr:protein-glutamate O-methyltransferase CheR [Gemmatimonadales bacterium]
MSAAAEADEVAFRRLTRRITERAGVPLDAYKDRCLRRRIAVRMRACGVHTFDAYRQLLEHEPGEVDRLLDALTINVTRFYRNPETWDRLASTHLPPLVADRKGAVHAWSAGCASGEEPYTLAMLLVDLAPRGADLSRCVIDASDLDRASLDRARAAAYPAPAFLELPPAMRDRHTREGKGQRVVNERVRRLVRFHRHDLIEDPPPAPPYDLVLCRNVVIYFDRETQERLFLRFAQALTPGGILVLGKVETLLGPARERLDLLDPRERIYRRSA